ncbi:MAG: DUF4097 domain-containing protein [Gemmatimonadota bacterium]
MMKLGGMAVLLAAAMLSPLQEEEAYRLDGNEVAVYNLAGRVQIVPGSGDAVVVRVARQGKDAERLTMDRIRIRDREALVIRYPEDHVVYPEMGRLSRVQLRVRDDGTFFGKGWKGWGGDRVRVTGSGRGLRAWADLIIEVPQGRSLDLALAAGDVEAAGVAASLSLEAGSGEVRARDVTGDVNIDTGSGEVDASEIRGSLRVDTGSGSVEVEGVRGREVLLDTGSGRVEAQGIEADRVKVDTGSGSVTLEEVAAPDIYVDTGSGSVEIEMLRDVEQLVVDTGSGSVTLYAPDDLGARVEVDTGSGGIDVDWPLRAFSKGRDHLKGEVGDGDGKILIDTGSGSVRLRRN